MEHILRYVQQNKAKEYSMSQINIETGLWLSDCLKKYFLFSSEKDRKPILVRKGARDTLCGADHVVVQFTQDVLSVKQIYKNYKNAGCYSAISVAEKLFYICKVKGVQLLRYEYNEPQKGKDQGDCKSVQGLLEKPEQVEAIEDFTEKIEENVFANDTENHKKEIRTLFKEQEKVFVDLLSDNLKIVNTRQDDIETKTLDCTKKIHLLENDIKDLKESLNFHEHLIDQKEVIGKNKQDHGNTKSKYVFTEDERTVINERKVIAESFNNFFINVGQNLANKITPGNKNFKSYIKEEDCVMDELEVSPDELRFAFNMFKPNKSSGLDDISPRVVKEVFDIIENPLLIIFNLSFNNGIFLDFLKLARVAPIFNDDDISKLSNYRPISILPCFSKILERIMHNRLYNYFIKHKLLNNNQYGFKKGYSTEHAINDSVNDTTGLDDKTLSSACSSHILTQNIL
ncbi:uncharacterized protein LOC136089978 [Hydra vulgaris]|uniref:Uncharacterized protein LOC136089978 n=1 Tax=Hydra vulgaris TaxID=6087 RepID=A0ABM4DCM5_HYDVU